MIFLFCQNSFVGLVGYLVLVKMRCFGKGLFVYLEAINIEPTVGNMSLTALLTI